VLKNIGVGAGKFLGVRRIFSQISPTLPEKYSKENDLQKNDCTSLHVGRIFSNQSTSSTIFAQIYRKRTKWKHDLQKKRLHFDFECYFCKIKSTYSDFTKVFSYFAQISPHILPRFSPNQKFWGCACPPAYYTSVEKYYMALTETQLKIWRFHGSLSQKRSRSCTSAHMIH